MIFTVIVEIDPRIEPATPEEVREVVRLSLLRGTEKRWKFTVWPAEKTEAGA